jgi:recombination protein RecR
MLPDRLRSLIHLLSRLPGVGEKTAQRFALHLVLDDDSLAQELGSLLNALPGQIGACEQCGNIAELDEQRQLLCAVCRDSRRDVSILCIVAKVQDLMALERSGAMRGRYFVLGRLLSPLDGIGPQELPLTHLYKRIDADSIREVILATPPSVDGEATALYLAQELSRKPLQVTRIASGVPHGGELEFADQITLGRAIAGRRDVEPTTGHAAKRDKS